MLRLPTLAWRTRGRGFSRAGGGVRYLLRDLFTTDRATGSVNGTAAEPGPGPRVVIDSESKLSISGGKLVITGGKAVPAAGDPGYWLPVFSRATGRTLLGTVNISGAGTSRTLCVDDNQSGDVIAGFRLASTNITIFEGGSPVIGAYAYSTDYDLAMALRSSGAIYLIKGGAFSSWTILWVEPSVNTASLYPSVTTFNSPVTADNVRVSALTGPWSKNDGQYTQNLPGARVTNDTFTHAANCQVDYTMTTLPDASNAGDVMIRRMNADNVLFSRVTSDGKVKLWEVVGATPTGRGEWVGVLAGDRISVVAKGTSVKVYVNGVIRINATTGSTLLGYTSGRIILQGTASISDLTSWPHEDEVPTGLATDWLPGYRITSDVYTHEANCLIEVIATKLADYNYVYFRRADATHNWYIRIQADGQIRLYEVDTATTLRGSSAAGAIAAGQRIVITAVGQTIKVYANNVLVITYALASTSETATGGLLTIAASGALSNVVSWPRTLSGTAFSELNKV